MLLLLIKAPAPRPVLIIGALLKPANQSANVLPSKTADTIKIRKKFCPMITAHKKNTALVSQRDDQGNCLVATIAILFFL